MVRIVAAGQKLTGDVLLISGSGVRNPDGAPHESRRASAAFVVSGGFAASRDEIAHRAVGLDAVRHVTRDRPDAPLRAGRPLARLGN